MQLNPLVSMCVLFHNQRDYVARTLAGVFMQDYSPLEIVMSDDGSTDGTYELLQRLLERLKADYPQFPVILNHNETALGMLGNREKVYSLAHGELLINVDGDDISFPSRAWRFAEVWIENKKKPTMMYCKKVVIDKNDHPLEFAHLNGKPLGATLAIASSVLPRFQAVADEAALHAYEDLVYIERCCLFGDMVAIDEPLVYYRYGTGETTRRKHCIKMTRSLAGVIASYSQVLRDIEVCIGSVPEYKLHRARTKAVKQIAYAESVFPLAISTSFLERLKCLLKTRYYRGGIKSIIASSILLLPHTIGDAIFSCIHRVYHIIRRFKARNQDTSSLERILEFSKQIISISSMGHL